jgi:drug/metabolite transporter (DMT)-like permease
MRLAYVAWVVVCIVWGTTYLGIRVALESFPVALLAGVRWTAAGALLAALVPMFGERLPPERAWGPIALTGFLMAVVGNGGVVWAQQYVASGVAAVIVASVPFWSILVEALIPGGERVTRRALIGLSVGFLGIIVLVWPQLSLDSRDARMFVYGVLSLQIATFGWALGTSYAKRNAMNVSPLGSAAVQMLLSGFMMMAIGTMLGEWNALTFTTRTVGAMVYLVLVGSVVGFSAYIYALKHMPISTVSLYAYINPIIAVLLGSVVLDEPFNARILAASALVLTGVAVASGRFVGRKAPAGQPGSAKAPSATVGEIAGSRGRTRALDHAQQVQVIKRQPSGALAGRKTA